MVPYPPASFEQLGAKMWRHSSVAASETTRHHWFRGFFGCLADICSILWDTLDSVENPTLQCVQPVHLLWTLMFLKQYNTKFVNAAVVGCDEKTFRSWVWNIVECLSDMDVVSTTVVCAVAINV